MKNQLPSTMKDTNKLKGSTNRTLRDEMELKSTVGADNAEIKVNEDSKVKVHTYYIDK